VWEPPSSQLEVPEPVLYNWQHGLKSVDESLDSNDETSEGKDRQSEESEESEETEENELGQHGDNRDHALAWGAQKPIGPEFLSPQSSILTITPRNPQN